MDPSIPLENGTSPFTHASNDVTDVIFRNLSDGQKKKMKMELVCKKFQSRIKERSSWNGENKLVLGKDEDGNILINGYKFSLEKAPMALFKLLDRITVKDFVLKDMPQIPLNILLALCDAIADHGDFINLKFIHIHASFDYSPVMTTLAGCGLENVVEIECGDWDNFKYVESLSPSFYSLLRHCHNLKLLAVAIVDISPIWEILLKALENCHKITSINVDTDKGGVLTQQNVVAFAQLCSCSTAFAKLTWLQFHSGSPVPEPPEFVGSLGGKTRLNLFHFGVNLNDGDVSHQLFLAEICNWFPNLKSLSIGSFGGFSTEAVLEAIGSIFANYGGQRADVYKFQFIIFVQNRGDVFTQLARKKWSDGDEFVEMVVKNDVWKCIKDNVEITLELDIIH